MDMDTLYLILCAVALLVIIALIVVICKLVKLKRSSCKGCRKILDYEDDFEMISSDLKWVEKTGKKRENGIEYDHQFLQYYRIITFNCKCSKCGKEYWFNRRYNLYRSDAKYSQSDGEQIRLLKKKIKSDFAKGVFKGVNSDEIVIGNIDY